MNIELIHKLSEDNLVLDALSRKKKLIEKKLYDIMILKIIVYYNKFLFIKYIKIDYKQDEDPFKLKKKLLKPRV